MAMLSFETVIMPSENGELNPIEEQARPKSA
jgi:hypothetical protein